jgi:hypothetical protein
MYERYPQKWLIWALSWSVGHTEITFPFYVVKRSPSLEFVYISLCLFSSIVISVRRFSFFYLWRGYTVVVRGWTPLMQAALFSNRRATQGSLCWPNAHWYEDLFGMSIYGESLLFIHSSPFLSEQTLQLKDMHGSWQCHRPQYSKIFRSSRSFNVCVYDVL